MLFVIILSSLVTASNPFSVSIESFEGNYRYIGGEEEKEKIRVAIDKVIEDLNFIMRPIARSRLASKNIPPTSIHIRRVGTGVAIKTPFRDWTTDLKGTVAGVTIPDGRPGKLSSQMQGPILIEILLVEENRRRHEFRLVKGGMQLKFKISLQTSKFPKPIVYELTYERTN